MTEEKLSFLTPEQLSDLLVSDPTQVDIDRIARLRAIGHNPYHGMVFDGMSTRDMVRVCIYNFFEARDFERAFVAIARLHRMEREEVRDAERAARAAGGEDRPRKPFKPRDPITGGPDPQPEPEPAPEPPPPSEALTRAAFAEWAKRQGKTLEQLAAEMEIGRFSSA